MTPAVPTDPRQRCTKALEHLRVVWRILEDAKVADQFRATMTQLAVDVKAALGGKEADGLDD
jgi:hypothetical protein